MNKNITIFVEGTFIHWATLFHWEQSIMKVFKELFQEESIMKSQQILKEPNWHCILGYFWVLQKSLLPELKGHYIIYYK